MNNNYDTCIIEYKIHAEYQQLLKHQIPNVYVIPSATSSFIWYGVIFLHQGLYEGGVFRFTLFIPENFDCPRVIFNPIVFHPLINNETGELDIKQYIPNWKRNIHHIYHVLFYIKEIFFQIETKNNLNKEAANLFKTNFELFMIRVKQSVDHSKLKLYDNPPINSDDPNAIKFSNLDEDQFNRIKKEMINQPEYGPD
ncbi:AKT-interacting -like [Brachionus plicatilis]|uniref:AKT-interacting-like n=1 Tax=Brachionus plicatilis TaxID=10195 RepID=A0A3M7SWY6_BRAPC|nr:AKT-interacting -like [Brachionus plicatilis]